jgi:hypothetical protein
MMIMWHQQRWYSILVTLVFFTNTLLVSRIADYGSYKAFFEGCDRGGVLSRSTCSIA